MALKWNGKEVSADLIEAFIRGSMLTAEDILTVSGNSVPRDTGTLARSGTITFDRSPEPETTYNEAKVKSVDSDSEYSSNIRKIYISYSTPYAWRQHEDLQLNHPNGGQAKYLEKAVNQVGTAEKLRRNIIIMARKLGLR